MFAAHPLSRFAVDATKISYITPAVRFGIGVDKLAIEAELGGRRRFQRAVSVTRVKQKPPRGEA
jgi:hypothetical protein